MNWLKSHAELFPLVWPIFTAIVTALFKARTPEQYDKLPPRLAAFVKLIGALGLDIPNTMEAIGQTVSGRKQSAGVYKAVRSSPPPAPPPIPEEGKAP